MAHIWESRPKLLNILSNQRIWCKTGHMICNQHKGSRLEGKINSTRCICKEQYFCILTAEFNYNICTRNKSIGGNSCCVNLLNKINADRLGNTHSGRTRKSHRGIFNAVNPCPYKCKNFCNLFRNSGIMPFICAVY